MRTRPEGCTCLTPEHRSVTEVRALTEAEVEFAAMCDGLDKETTDALRKARAVFVSDGSVWIFSPVFAGKFRPGDCSP